MTFFLKYISNVTADAKIIWKFENTLNTWKFNKNRGINLAIWYWDVFFRIRFLYVIFLLHVSHPLLWSLMTLSYCILHCVSLCWLFLMKLFRKKKFFWCQYQTKMFFYLVFAWSIKQKFLFLFFFFKKIRTDNNYYSEEK